MPVKPNAEKQAARRARAKAAAGTRESPQASTSGTSSLPRSWFPFPAGTTIPVPDDLPADLRAEYEHAGRTLQKMFTDPESVRRARREGLTLAQREILDNGLREEQRIRQVQHGGEQPAARPINYDTFNSITTDSAEDPVTNPAENNDNMANLLNGLGLRMTRDGHQTHLVNDELDFSLDVTEEGFALGYVFDIVLRGSRATPMEDG